VREISLIGLGLALAPTLLNFHVEHAHAVENVGKIVVATSNYLTRGLSVNTDVANLLLNAAIKPFIRCAERRYQEPKTDYLGQN